MNRDHDDRFCSRVCAHVRFSPDHAADGTLIYQSPLPESWAEDYSIPDPDNWRLRYEALYPGEVGS